MSNTGPKKAAVVAAYLISWPLILLLTYVVLISGVLPVQKQLGYLVFYGTAGVSLSAITLGLRGSNLIRAWLDSGTIPVGFLVIWCSSALGIFLGWFIAAWGVVVPKDSRAAEAVPLLLGVGIVLISHVAFEWQLRGRAKRGTEREE